MNGRKYSKSALKAMSAYVMQDDLLHAELTVEETVLYQAKLRLLHSETKVEEQEVLDRVEDVLVLMGIGHVRHVAIGDSVRKGVSGGERKRVCVAIELLSRPKLMFLDEVSIGCLVAW